MHIMYKISSAHLQRQRIALSTREVQLSPCTADSMQSHPIVYCATPDMAS